MTALVVIAKQPIAGRVKTRLHPPLSLEQAAELAAASIDDTLHAMERVPASRRVLLWDGADAPAATGYEVLPQSAGSLDLRLAAAFDAIPGPLVLIGMDTPQVTADDLAPVFDGWPEDVDAWLGPAADGGFWALAMRRPRGDLIRGVEMSRDDTGLRQRERLESAGLRVGTLRALRDVDTFADAVEVAATAPGTAFARVLTGFGVAAPPPPPRPRA